MIAGIGVDVVDCTAFARLLSEPGSAFAEETFTPLERVAARSGDGSAESRLAARFAAKEACIKALSAALAPRPLPAAPVTMSEIEVVSDDARRPRLALSGRVRALAEEAGLHAIHVSISHDGPVAVAFVVMER